MITVGGVALFGVAEIAKSGVSALAMAKSGLYTPAQMWSSGLYTPAQVIPVARRDDGLCGFTPSPSLAGMCCTSQL